MQLLSLPFFNLNFCLNFKCYILCKTTTTTKTSERMKTATHIQRITYTGTSGRNKLLQETLHGVFFSGVKVFENEGLEICRLELVECLRPVVWFWLCESEDCIRGVGWC